MASELERSLSEILSECAAPAALSIFLKTEGLTTCALFYDCVKNIDDLEGKVAARLVPAASSLRDLSVIRTVWRRAKVEAEKALSGSVDAPEDWEIPLNPTTKNALTSKSAAAYGTVFRARKMPCDSLLGRVYREREKQCLTAFPLGRVRSLATSPQTKERFLVVGRVVSCVVFFFFFFGGGGEVSVAGFVRPSFGSLGSFVRSFSSWRWSDCFAIPLAPALSWPASLQISKPHIGKLLCAQANTSFKAWHGGIAPVRKSWLAYLLLWHLAPAERRPIGGGWSYGWLTLHAFT